MKNLLPAFSLLLSLPLLSLGAAAQKSATVSRVGEFTLDWSKGVIDAAFPTPSGKVTVALTGTKGPVSFVGQEAGSARLAKNKLRSQRRELTAQSIVVLAQQRKQGKQTLMQVKTATAQKDVIFLLEQVSLEGEKSTTKVRCDQAVFKAGAKPGTGRLDFSGNARVWTYGAGVLESSETATSGGWIDLGDPDDAENKPPTLHLESGSSSGSLKEDGGGKKKG
jgi:hypothetical protein